MSKKLSFTEHGVCQNVMRGSWRLGAVSTLGGKRAFLCLHGAQNGHCYSSAELREIADKVDELQEGESKKTALVFIQVDGPVGAALIVHNRKGALGTINIDGRWPGRWKSWQNSNRRSVSPEEMMEIAVKCAELARK